MYNQAFKAEVWRVHVMQAEQSSGQLELEVEVKVGAEGVQAQTQGLRQTQAQGNATVDRTDYPMLESDEGPELEPELHQLQPRPQPQARAEPTTSYPMHYMYSAHLSLLGGGEELASSRTGASRCACWARFA